MIVVECATAFSAQPSSIEEGYGAARQHRQLSAIDSTSVWEAQQPRCGPTLKSPDNTGSLRQQGDRCSPEILSADLAEASLSVKGHDPWCFGSTGSSSLFPA